MSYMTAGKLQAFEALMTEKPGFEHYDSGCDGILCVVLSAAATASAR